jgi:predicted MPP superfamily phosphohydrolase
MSSNPITRRNVLRAGVATGAALAAPQVLSAAAAVHPVTITPTTPPREGKPFRIAHLTDMHVTEKHDAQAGFAAALKSLEKIDPSPAFLITGGDHIMDALVTTRERAVEQWDMYAKILAAGTKLKTHACIGNHDVWGWMSKTDDYSAHKDFGKPIAVERLGIKDRYYSFDDGGWHFVMLDNIKLRDRSYYGAFDDAQQGWLEKDLAANMAGGRLPVCVVTHIPLCGISPFFFGKGGEKGEDFYRTTDNLMHHNVKPLLRQLAKGNVKLCISGHTHLLDRVDYLGISFVCDGAVSGNWWGGPYQDFQEGYGVFDLYANGAFEHRYVDYGWRSVKEV